MNIVFVLLPIALVFAAVAVCVFIWAVKAGQLDDLKTPAMRILDDDEAKQADPPGDRHPS